MDSRPSHNLSPPISSILVMKKRGSNIGKQFGQSYYIFFSIHTPFIAITSLIPEITNIFNPNKYQVQHRNLCCCCRCFLQHDRILVEKSLIRVIIGQHCSNHLYIYYKIFYSSPLNCPLGSLLRNHKKEIKLLV